MAISEAYVNSGTSITTTEYSLPNAANYSSGATITTDGVYQAFIDFANMAAGDQYQIKVYEKVYGAGTQRAILTSIVTGTQSGPYVTPSLILLHGWDISVKKLGGTDRSISWSIRQIA